MKENSDKIKIIEDYLDNLKKENSIIGKIKQSMQISVQKQKMIDEKKNSRKGLSYQKVLEINDEIAKSEKDKEVFDGMTIAALLDLRTEILTKKQDLEAYMKEYIEDYNKEYSSAKEEKEKYQTQKEQYILETNSEEEKRIEEEEAKKEKRINELTVAKEKGLIDEETYNKKVNMIRGAEIHTKAYLVQKMDERIKNADNKMKKMQNDLILYSEYKTQYMNDFNAIEQQVEFVIRSGITKESIDIFNKPLPSQQHTQNPQPSNPQPGGQQPGGQQPGSQQPGGQQPGGQQPGGQQPGSQQPGGQQPGGQQPGGQQPGGQQPGGQQPGGQQPGGQQPGGQQPGGQQPGGQQPGGQQPGGQQPGGQQPGGQQPGEQQPGGQQPGGQQPGGQQPGGQPTPVQPKDVIINIGKEVTYSFKKDGKIIENSINLETFKGVLKQKIFKDIEKELCKKMNRKEKDKAIYDLTGKVNPIVYEVLKRIDSEIGSDIPVYSENYLNAIIQDKSELFMADVVYDENQYKRRSILDRIKALPIINKALNKKEINTIERYADLDEKDKMARVIRKSNRNQKRLNKGQQPSGQQSEQPKGQQKHDDFVEKLHAIAKEYQMKIDDPDDKLTSQQMEQKNAQRKAKQQQTSTDYLDKEWEK